MCVHLCVRLCVYVCVFGCAFAFVSVCARACVKYYLNDHCMTKLTIHPLRHILLEFNHFHMTNLNVTGGFKMYLQMNSSF